ncbi:putative delta-60 repeat protein [Prosthecobacter fusiformis]|uniref:Putative delta-60 repeat protein n=1 Tax=Prosthecobacter fusiformis TaxID=48464 RepID=A0A4R7S0T1_9BACT|nr:cadherin-like beta sandwich domain-containing protein [Prosthecobacter fusiformis]TDU70775.1 putative delta-60 repeat protein [Prosthecobacter fusiformis]
MKLRCFYLFQAAVVAGLLWASGPVQAAPGDLDTLDLSVVGNTVHATVMQADGKMIVAGDFTSVLGVGRGHIARLNANGSLDVGFNPQANGRVYAVTVQADGKILAGGDFTSFQPNGVGGAIERNRVARLNVDGTVDASFDPKANLTVFSLALQTDGKVLLGGFFTTLQPNGAAESTPRNYLARVNTDGTVDASFDPKPNNLVRSVVVQEDGKILLGGAFGSLQPNGAAEATLRSRIARVYANGTLDADFDPKTDGIVYTVAVQADGKILLGGLFASLQPNGALASTARSRIARVNADGTLDMGFDPRANNSVFSIAVQTNGQILLGGLFSSLQPNGAAVSTLRNRIARVNGDGTLDTEFDPKPNNDVYSVGLQADGKILIGGTFGTLQPNGASVNTTRNRFARLMNDGVTQELSAPDITQVRWERDGAAPEVSQVTFEVSQDSGTTYTPLSGVATREGNTGSNWQLQGVSLPNSGQLRARAKTVGGYQNGSGGMVELVANFNTTESKAEIAVEYPFGTEIETGVGSVDFGSAASSGDGTGSTVRTFKVKNSGTDPLAGLGITFSGEDAGAFTVSAPAQAPVLPNGETTFTVRFSPEISGPNTARLLLASNDADENPYEIQVTGTGLISGNANLSGLTLSAGTLSPAFAAGTMTYVASVPYGDTSLTVTPMLKQPNATITVNGAPVLSGAVSSNIPLTVGMNTITVMVTAENETTQKTYTLTVTRGAAVAGDVDEMDVELEGTDVYAVAVQADGKVLIGGNFSSVLGVPRNHIARLNNDGTLDATFDPKAGGGIISCLTVQEDGKILVGGSFTSMQPNGAAESTPRHYIARLNTDGTLDATFDPKPNNVVRSVAVQADGMILLGGDFTTLQPNGGVTSTPRSKIARVNAQGEVDMDFDPRTNGTVFSVVEQTDGKILLGGAFTSLQPNGAEGSTARMYMARVNADGTLDTAFDPQANAVVYAMAMQGDGRILMAGAFTTLHPGGVGAMTPRTYLARLNDDGTVDGDFDPGPDQAVFSVVRQTNGKILIGGNFTTLRANGAAVGTARSHVARVNGDGTLDLGFNPRANGTVHAVTLLADGKIVAGGNFTTLQANGAGVSTGRNLLVRLANEAAVATLSAPNTSVVNWVRSGAAPEVSQVKFAVSTDGGTTFSDIPGMPVRMGSTNWQLDDLTLPANGHLRARGKTYGGFYSSSGGMVETVIAFSGLTTPVPVIVVEQPTGRALVHGSGTVALAAVSNTSQTFVIRNAGTAALKNLALSVTGPNAGSFTPGALGMTTLQPGGSTSFTISAPSVVQQPVGYQTATLHITSNDPVQGSFDVPMTYSYLVRSNWRMTHYGNWMNEGDAADAADPDFNGLSNLLEFATGMRSATGNGQPMPGRLVRNGSQLEYTYTRLKAAKEECSFNVEWNDGLREVSWNRTGVTETLLTDDGILETVKAVMPAGSMTRRFVRLTVSGTADPVED